MAFGFGFNKQKALSAAEKFVQQGKLQNAIAEYEKVRKHDEKDLTVANTIGDLYARLGDSTKAIQCFKTVGDAYAAQGFTVKGIAMYKKITKLQPSVDGSLKLAELYTQQGLFNDARAQYLQVADDFMKNGELEQAVRLFQKVLEMDPENVPMRIKLAEVYLRLNKKKEAWEVFGAAAEALRARGSLAAAEDVLQRMLVLDPENSYVLLMRGRSALESGDWKSAISYLEKASDIDSHPEGLRDLLKAYLAGEDLEKCAPIAEKLLTVHNEPEGLFVLAEGSAKLGHYDQALEIYTRHSDRLLATDATKLLGNLHAMITHVRDDRGALEKLLELLKKSGETTHINEVAELLAHASVRDGELVKARNLYQTLASSEPQNTIHMQNYQQVVERLNKPASAIPPITADEGALIVEELEATAPLIDQQYPDEVAVAVRSAVTDADLFLSYNLPEKAITPLMCALSRAPHDVRVNQRLAALHTRFHHFADAAACCRTLETAYHEAGHVDEAARYKELASRYEQNVNAEKAASAGVLESAGEPVAWPANAAVSGSEEAGHPEFAVQPIDLTLPSNAQDLSSEWENALSVAEPAAQGEPSTAAEKRAENNAEIAETVDEIRFYLEHLMPDQARSAFEKLSMMTHDAAVLGPLRAALDSAAKATDDAEVEISELPDDELPEINADDLETFQIELTPPQEHGTVASSERTEQPEGWDKGDVASTQPADHSKPDELTALVADLEASIGDFPAVPMAAAPQEVESTSQSTSQSTPSEAGGNGHAEEGLPGWPSKVPGKQVSDGGAKREAAPVVPPVASSAAASAEMKPVVVASTGGAAAAPAMSYTSSPVRPLGAEAGAVHPSDSVDLSEMFSELRHELEGESVADSEDPETHYNMGAAFREMGLLDEAIAELQTVCTAIDRGQPFGQVIQTYTWLAQCFLDKGVPEAAIRWYEKALNIPGLDNETRLAINYELGSACERAQDRPAALRHFTYVYGANIDYRDVAERIQALKS